MNSGPTWTEQDVLDSGLEGGDPTDPGPAVPAFEPKKNAPSAFKLVSIVAVAGLLGYGVGDLGKPYVRRWIHGPAVKLQEGPRYEVSLRGDEPTRGPKDALVTIISFSDYQCPHCAKAEKILGEFLEAWRGEPVRVIYKNYPLPLHDQALPAAYAAWAAHMQQKFEPVHHWLFEHHAAVDELSKAEVESLGLDHEKFTQDRDAPATREAVDDDRRSGGLLHLRATPSFVVNGHIYTANWSQAVWEDVVEWELKDARKLVKQGVKPTDVLKALLSASPAKGAPADPEQEEEVQAK